MTTFQCTTCGKISSDKSEICDSSKEISSLYVCESCNKHSASQESICNPVKVEPSFYCGKCGTSAHEKGKLCEPLSV